MGENAAISAGFERIRFLSTMWQWMAVGGGWFALFSSHFVSSTLLPCHP